MENLKSSRIKLPDGMGGKFKYCSKHNIDSLSSPGLFNYVKDTKYRKLQCKICNNAWHKRYRDENKTIVKIRKDRWKNENREQHNAYQRSYTNERRRVDINYRLIKQMRSRMSSALKRNYKSAKTMELTGCTMEFLRAYLESKFEDGMSWDNYGAWHIDHIIACANFNMADPEQQRICFHYTNLQPMWAEQNLKKGARLC
jgi:hypothetical protein